jgi:hypothetical protein
MDVSLTPLGRVGPKVWFGLAEFPKIGCGGGLALLYQKLFLIEFESHTRTEPGDTGWCLCKMMAHETELLSLLFAVWNITPHSSSDRGVLFHQ